MALRLVTIAIALLHVAATLPVTLDDVEAADDLMSVGSHVREARAAPPENFHRSYESDGDGEIGYSRKKNGGGKKGYQHFDSYHKKAGDNYVFEKQDSFGLDDEAKDEGRSHEHERKGDYDDGEGAYSHHNERNAEDESHREPESEEVDEGHSRRPYKKEKGRKNGHDHEQLKEGGSSDGNGGVESFGHNPDDYILPEKYTYGSGEEYNY